jgi:hypothetical protein
MWVKKGMGRFPIAVFACVFLLVGVVESLAGAAELAMNKADKPLRLGARLSLNSIGEVTDAPWGVYADGVGKGTTISFDVSYSFLSWLNLHSGIGLDYRYFSSGHRELSLECDCEGGSHWAGYNKDYLLYLEVPLLAQAHIPNVLYFEAGPVFDFKLMRKSSFFLPKSVRTDKCHEDRTFGAGASFGIGHVFSSGLFVDVHLMYRLTDVVSVDKTCGSYTVSWGSSRTDAGTESVTQGSRYIDESIVGSYYLFNKVQLGVGYWF